MTRERRPDGSRAASLSTSYPHGSARMLVVSRPEVARCLNTLATAVADLAAQIGGER